MNRKKPLYRKVNTNAKGVRHNFGGDSKFVKNAKRDSLEQVKGSMHGKQERGKDYTPLFKFLYTKVGQDWNEVFDGVISRLNTTESIFWLVAINQDEKESYVRIGGSTYFSKCSYMILGNCKW